MQRDVGRVHCDGMQLTLQNWEKLQLTEQYWGQLQSARQKHTDWLQLEQA